MERICKSLQDHLAKNTLQDTNVKTKVSADEFCFHTMSYWMILSEGLRCTWHDHPCHLRCCKLLPCARSRVHSVFLRFVTLPDPAVLLPVLWVTGTERRRCWVSLLCGGQTRCPHCPTQQLALPVSSGTSSHGVGASLSSYCLSQPPTLLTSSLLVQQLNQHWCRPAGPVLHLRPLVFVLFFFPPLARHIKWPIAAASGTGCNSDIITQTLGMSHRVKMISVMPICLSFTFNKER